MTQQSRPKLITSGGHTAWMEEDEDVAFVKYTGKLDVRDMTELLSFLEKNLDLKKRFYTISESSKDFFITPEARTLLTKWVKSNPMPELIINIGENKAMRFLLGLMFRGYSLIYNKPSPMVFVDTEEEARLMVREYKKKRQRG